MPKLSSTLPLSLRGPKTGTPLYRWLYDELRLRILSGQLRPGTRLPATRDLAAQYGLSRPTIVTAFEQLRSEGYVEGKVGSGTYVSQTLPDELLQASRAKPSTIKHRRRVTLSNYAKRLKTTQQEVPRDVLRSRASRASAPRAFRAGQPALDAFPSDLWAQVASRRLRRVSTGLLAGGEALGYRPLREAVAEYLNTSRGVDCSAEQVLIISGVQEALDRAAHLLLNPGDPVWMEEPGYPRAAACFSSVGAKICPVSVDNEGLDFKVGQSRYPIPPLIYVTPAHQFPLGVTMSLPRRLSLLEWARKSGVMIFEDDYDSEYRYSGRPVPALQGLDRAGVVIYAGSFTDALFPALRLGYLVAPPVMVEIFGAAASVSTHHPPLIDQAILCDFIVEGHFARHVRRMRELYAERLGVLIKEVRAQLSGLLNISDVEAGLRTVGWLPQKISAERVAKAAANCDVEVVPISRYAFTRSRLNGLVLGFAAVDGHELKRGVQELARVLNDSRAQ